MLLKLEANISKILFRQNKYNANKAEASNFQNQLTVLNSIALGHSDGQLKQVLLSKNSEWFTK